MNNKKSLLLAFVLLLVVAALYRIIPSRPFGFAPQIAMAVFAGAIIRDKKWAFALPLFSMFLSDLLYHSLYMAGIGITPGFYNGQFTNYVLFGLLTVVGFFIRKVNLIQVGVASLVAPTLYFLLSNFAVWMFGGGWGHPKTFDGLMMTYADGIPFYQGNLMATVVFGVVLFGGYYLLKGKQIEKIEMA
ncbi:MAG TPA: DUF6580 family putative transport protein [Flavihumibacter sp.]